MLGKWMRAFTQRRQREYIYKKADYWDAKASSNSGSSISMWKNQSLNQYYQDEQFRFIEANLPHDLTKIHALDLGCGTGRVARYLNQRGAQTLGIDFSEQSLEVARKIGPQKIDYVQGSVLNFNISQPVDIIIVLGVLSVACSTEEEIDAVLAGISRALTKNGKLIVIEPFHTGFLRRVLKMSFNQFVERTEAAGFTIKQHQELHFWPFRLVLSYINWPKWVTAIGYNMGRLAMIVFGKYFGFGDYKAIYAVRDK